MKLIQLLASGILGGGGIFTGLTHAWPLTEASGMRREARSSNGDDFYPVGATTANGHLSLDGTNDYAVCGNSAALELGSDTAFTFSIRVKPTATSGTRWIVSKQDLSSNELYEYSIYHSGATVNFRIGNGTTFQTVSRGSSLSAGVETLITIGHDPVNNIISLKVGTNAIVTAAWSGGTQRNKGGLWLGTANQAASSFFNGEVWNALFWNGRYLSDAEQLALAGATYPFGALAVQDTALEPDEANYAKYSRHDFGDLSSLWQNVAKTTPVAVDTDPIRVVEDAWNDHDWTAPNDTVRPLWKANAINSLGAAVWDGVDSEMDFDQAWPDSNLTVFFVVKNIDATNGSHIVTPALYLAITGSSYVSGTYAVLHPGGGSPAVQSVLTNGDNYHIIEVTFNTNTNQYRIVTNGGALGEATNSGTWAAAQSGPYEAGLSDWWFDGEMAEVIRFNDIATIADKMRMRTNLASKYGLTVSYRGC